MIILSRHFLVFFNDVVLKDVTNLFSEVEESNFDFHNASFYNDLSVL